MADSNIKSLEAKCYCGSVHFTIDIPTAKLPLATHLCHCSICRYQSGAPAVFHTELPDDVEPRYIAPSSPVNLTTYVGEGRTSSWQFCSTCGCHIATVGIQPDRLGRIVMSTSIFKEGGPENFKISRHIYTDSTGDGGIASMLTSIGGREIEVWNPPEGDAGATKAIPDKKPDIDDPDRLRAECYCGGVSFTIQRPTHEALNDEFMSTFVSPLDRTKWLGTLDACDDCRLVTGTHVIGWTFVPLKVCEPAIASDLLIGTAKTYVSSPGVLRSFCGTCGATVFYSCDDRHVGLDSQVVDVAVGILQAREGSMAESWLTWRSRLGAEGSGRRYDNEFTEALVEGSKKWVIERCGKELTFTIG
ncbi:DUF636 domain protein [Stachybotrys elegans]|uniref:DUF636 domain protein n=1 Tax=Stachybotrys elegans TaxID=80388 RepID=A0A8K0SNS8_9HYPO|nr:DUF636 domain protein [Stachybotrys elegans]